MKVEESSSSARERPALSLDQTFKGAELLEKRLKTFEGIVASMLHPSSVPRDASWFKQP